MLGHGTIHVQNDETINQEAGDWEHGDGCDEEEVYGGELIEEDADYGEEKNEKFTLKNGCCRECMKAFSKSGKVSTQASLLIYLELPLLSPKTIEEGLTTCEWL